MTTDAKRESAHAYVRRGLETVKRGRPRKLHIEGEFDWLLERKKPQRHYGKSESNPGRYCKNIYCRSFVPDKDAPCRECGSTS